MNTLRCNTNRVLDIEIEQDRGMCKIREPKTVFEVGPSNCCVKVVKNRNRGENEWYNKTFLAHP